MNDWQHPLFDNKRCFWGNGQCLGYLCDSVHIFGAFLQKSGAGRFFIDYHLSIAGRSPGGPAKVAVISSALFGSVSGSAIANTVSTGSFTIPLMKRVGFKPHVAGAIEPAASIEACFYLQSWGGWFLDVRTDWESLRQDHAALHCRPALLYFLSVLVMVHFEAKRLGLGGLDQSEEIPSWQQVLREGLVFLFATGRNHDHDALWPILEMQPFGPT